VVLLTAPAWARPGSPGEARPVHAQEGPGPAGSLILVERSDATPLLHFGVTLRGGTRHVPPGQEGLAHLIGQVLGRGSPGVSEEAFRVGLRRLGTQLTQDVDRDSITFSIEVKRELLDPALGVLAPAILDPRDPEDEHPWRLEMEGRETEAELRDGRALALRCLGAAVFAGTDAAAPLYATLDSLGRLDVGEALRLYRERLVGGNVIFHLSGPISLVEAAPLVRRHFAALPAGGALPLRGLGPAAGRARLYHGQMRAAEQDERRVHVVVGQAAPQRFEPGYLPMRVAARALDNQLPATVQVRMGEDVLSGLLWVETTCEPGQELDLAEQILDVYQRWARNTTSTTVEQAAREVALDLARARQAPMVRVWQRMVYRIHDLPEPLESPVAGARRQSAISVAEAKAVHARPEALQICLIGPPDWRLPARRGKRWASVPVQAFAP
jgi:predicted Zn-dependent peptidase